MAEIFDSPALSELQWRGFLQDITHQEELDSTLKDEKVTLYCGFDPTASSLHVGNLVGVMALVHFARHGHRPLALVGGATGLIGDPSGKDEERELLSDEQLEQNAEGIKGQLNSILSQAIRQSRETGATASGEFKMVNNADWLRGVTYLEFLRDVGKCFSVNAMMGKESVRARLEEREHGISYTEFSYMLIQAFDFLHLFENEDCRLQVGGSDQWGNITAGLELIRRSSDNADRDAFGLTFPLITSADGKKLGKSVKGAIFLDPELTSPYDFYQYWVNRPDQDCAMCLRLFTFLSRQEIEEMEATIDAGENRGEVQRKLAWEVTTLIHGEEQADLAVRASKMLFGEEIEGLTDEDLASIFSDVPSTEFSREKLKSGELGILDAFTETELQRSNGATRRLIKQGGAYLNNVRIEDHDKTLGEEDLASESMMVVRSGKKNYHVLRFTD